MSVSRGTRIPGPPSASAVFADELERVERYAGMLATAGVERGLLGPREAPRLWSRHLLNCAVVEEIVPGESSVCDVGSGAGLPGMVVALARADVEMVLLEPILRRWSFLTEVIAELDVGDRVSAVRERAEEHAGRYDMVMARAVAPLERLVRWSLPLCHSGGSLAAMKGERANAELTGATKTLRTLGAASWRIEQLGWSIVDPPTTVVRVEAGEGRR